MEQLKDLLTEHLSDQLAMYEDEDYTNAYTSFRNHFPNSQIMDLEYVKARVKKGRDPLIVFKLNGNLICYKPDRYCDKCDYNCSWYTIDKMVVSKSGSQKIGKMDCDIPELMADSTNRITYEIYPFEQGFELSLPELGIKKKSLGYPNEFDEDEPVSWSDGLTVRVGENDKGITYSIFDGDKFISGLCDSSYSLQLGDAFSAAYRYGTDLVIRNCGDVSSVVILKLA